MLLAASRLVGRMRATHCFCQNSLYVSVFRLQRTCNWVAQESLHCKFGDNKSNSGNGESSYCLERKSNSNSIFQDVWL